MANFVKYSILDMRAIPLSDLRRCLQGIDWTDADRLLAEELDGLHQHCGQCAIRFLWKSSILDGARCLRHHGDFYGTNLRLPAGGWQSPWFHTRHPPHVPWQDVAAEPLILQLLRLLWIRCLIRRDRIRLCQSVDQIGTTVSQSEKIGKVQHSNFSKNAPCYIKILKLPCLIFNNFSLAE